MSQPFQNPANGFDVRSPYGWTGCGYPAQGYPVPNIPYGLPVYDPVIFGHAPNTQSSYAQPIYGQPIYGQPVYGQPIYGQPVQGQPTFGQPLSDQPIASQLVPLDSTASTGDSPVKTDSAKAVEASAPALAPASDPTSSAASIPLSDVTSPTNASPTNASSSQTQTESTTSAVDSALPAQSLPKYGQPSVMNAPTPQYGYPSIAVQQPRKSHGWIVALVAVICFFALMFYGAFSCSRMIGGDASESFSTSPNSIAVIQIDGAIQYDGSTNSPEGLARLLNYAKDDDSIKAVVLRVNSGGGVATAGEEMAALVRDFTKPIVVSSASLNASAAYEISSQADRIFVSKTTEIGSIGTAIELTNLSGLMEMLGIEVDVIASSDSKDSSYGYRSLSEDERAYYQRMVDQINRVFIENVAQGRNMPVSDVEQLANGLVYTGIDAVENGLADEIGSQEDAIAYAAELAEIEDYDSFNLSFTNKSLGALEYLDYFL